MGEAEERDRTINIVTKNITISAIASLMYIPNAFREEDTEKLVAFMRSNSFAREIGWGVEQELLYT